MKLNLKIRHLLYHISINSRQSFVQIGRKIGLSKQNVSYKIKNLEEIGIIKNYQAHIDAYRLGYDVVRLYITYQYTSPEVEKEIITYFTNCKLTWAVYSVKGWFDLDVIFWVKNIEDIYDFWVKTQELYGDYFENQTFSHLVQFHGFRPTYLIPESFDKTERDKIMVIGGRKKIEVNDLDIKILRLITQNARMPIVDIADSVGSNVKTIDARLKKLVKSKVIQAFSTQIDIEKIGFKFYAVYIYLRDHSKRNEIIKYLQYNPYLNGIDNGMGPTDLQLEFYVRDIDHLHQIMKDLSNKFPGAIRNYKQVSVNNIHKLVWMPEE